MLAQPALRSAADKTISRLEIISSPNTAQTASRRAGGVNTPFP